MKIFLYFFLSLTVSFFAVTASARTTPADILNSQKSAYDQKVAAYSTDHQQKLAGLSQKITGLNKKITADLGQNMERQGQILEEYIRRNSLEEKSNNGITRNLNEPVENARYWLTFAHEAVAYQAGKIYIFNLTSKSNIKSDTNSTITQLEADINILNSKALKSQKIIKNLVTSRQSPESR
ncbi:hypothetical protein HYW46_04000 [Candidatus Daviesbacteria bacterium]|nr:hypothetical protein [Candidatus Daviesbacteria bacterium]